MSASELAVGADRPPLSGIIAGRPFLDDTGELWSVWPLGPRTGDDALMAQDGDTHGLVVVRHTTQWFNRVDRQADRAGHGDCGAWYVRPDKIVVCAGLLDTGAGPGECGVELFALSDATKLDQDRPPAGVKVPVWPPAAPALPPFALAAGRAA